MIQYNPDYISYFYKNDTKAKESWRSCLKCWKQLRRDRHILLLVISTFCPANFISIHFPPCAFCLWRKWMNSLHFFKVPMSSAIWTTWTTLLSLPVSVPVCLPSWKQTQSSNFGANQPGQEQLASQSNESPDICKTIWYPLATTAFYCKGQPVVKGLIWHPCPMFSSTPHSVDLPQELY